MPAGAAGSTISEEFKTQYRVEAHRQKREQRVAHRQTIGTTAAQGVQAHAIVEDPRYASGKTYTLSAADVSLASLKTTSQSYGMGKKATDLWSRFLISKHEEVAVPDLTVLFMYGAFVALDINAALAVPHMGAPILLPAVEAGGRRDILPALLDPGVAAAGPPAFANLTTCMNEGGTHIPITGDSGIYAHVVWSQLRGFAANPGQPLPPLVVVAANAYA